MNKSGLISFRIDWFDLLAVQGTFKSLLQHHRLKASVLLFSAFFVVQVSHPYKTSGKIIALTIQTFVSKVMSLLFNMLCRFVIVFLPRSKNLLISWLQSTSGVIFEARENKDCHCFPIYLPWSDTIFYHYFDTFLVSNERAHHLGLMFKKRPFIYNAIPDWLKYKK